MSYSSKKKRLAKFKHRCLITIRDEATLEKKFSLRLTLLNVVLVVGTTSILLVFITSYIIAFTPLKAYIPGFTDINLDKKLKTLVLRTDSLEKTLQAKDEYLINLKKVISGNDNYNSQEAEPPKQSEANKKGNVNLDKSFNDSMFRKEYEEADKYNLLAYDEGTNSETSIRNYNFFSPLKGMISNHYNLSKEHYGIDIVSKKDEPIKSVLDGIVVFSDWSIKTGYTIALQHQGNLVSVYKHNSVLLKKEGDRIKAGEVIAIIGNSGDLSSGVHLHFELWFNGKPVNPAEYIYF